MLLILLRFYIYNLLVLIMLNLFNILLKKCCHRVNQSILLNDLHDRHIANSLLISPTVGPIPKTVESDIPSSDEIYVYHRSAFNPGCYQCQRQDQILCSIQDIQGWNNEVAVNGLINSVFHPFAITNSDRYFVFQV